MRPTRSDAVLSLRPGASFALDNAGELIAWHGPGDAPTSAEVTAELDRMVTIWGGDAWRRSRLEEYPSLEQLTVAAWEAQVEGRPEAATALQALRETVKLKYPKPVSS